MSISITAIFAAIFAIISVPLSLQITMHYIKAGTRQGMPETAGDEILRRKTRTHGNFIEYVPLALILLALMEISGASSLFLFSMGGSFVFARLIHAYGSMHHEAPTLRAIGMMIGHIYYGTGAVWLLYHHAPIFRT